MNPIVSLIPTSAKLSVSNDKGEASQHLYFMAKQALKRSIRTKDDVELGHLLWEVQISEATQLNDFLRSNKAIGSASYLPEVEDWEHGFSEAGFSAWAALEPAEFSALREALLSGAVPGRISLEVAGLEYGWEPDGSSKVWDIKSDRSLLVTAVTVASTPALSFTGDDIYDEDAPLTQTPPPATSQDIQSLAAVAARIETALHSQVRWMIIIGGVVVVAVLLQ